MNSYPKVNYGQVYHIFNRGNNGENLFLSQEDNKHFLKLYEKYIEPIAETYAWCLLRNHFHLLVKIRLKDDIGYFNPFYASCSKKAGRSYNYENNEVKWQLISENDASLLDGKIKENLKRPVPSRQFSHLFNSYSKYMNAKYKRTGSLFEKNFRRICVQNQFYFRHLVIYIHKNPQKHGITDNFRHYPWSSFNSILSIQPTKIKRETVIGWFDDEAMFMDLHTNLSNNFQITDLIFE